MIATKFINGKCKKWWYGLKVKQIYEILKAVNMINLIDDELLICLSTASFLKLIIQLLRMLVCQLKRVTGF